MILPHLALVLTCETPCVAGAQGRERQIVSLTHVVKTKCSHLTSALTSPHSKTYHSAITDSSWSSFTGRQIETFLLHKLHRETRLMAVFILIFYLHLVNYFAPATYLLEGRGVHKVLVGKPEGKRPLGRQRRRWEDNIKMEHRKWEGVVGTGCSWLRIGTGGGCL